MASYRTRMKLKALEHMGGKCQLCGYARCAKALQFHHIDPSQKDFSISHVTRSWERIKDEIEKCVLVCANCHAEIHAGLIKLAPSPGLEPGTTRLTVERSTIELGWNKE